MAGRVSYTASNVHRGGSACQLLRANLGNVHVYFSIRGNVTCLQLATCCSSLSKHTKTLLTNDLKRFVSVCSMRAAFCPSLNTMLSENSSSVCVCRYNNRRISSTPDISVADIPTVFGALGQRLATLHWDLAMFHVLRARVMHSLWESGLLELANQKFSY